jgi:hypothetical protein
VSAKKREYERLRDQLMARRGAQTEELTSLSAKCRYVRRLYITRGADTLYVYVHVMQCNAMHPCRTYMVFHVRIRTYVFMHPPVYLPTYLSIYLSIYL